MSLSVALPNRLKPKREKVFGDGRPVPLDRNMKARIMVLARALMHKTEAGKHYGAITAKAYAVLEALLWAFHNARSGLCFPSYERIAEQAGCARSTVAEAIKALELAGILSWVNRIARVRDAERDLFGKLVPRWRVVRISNGYAFRDPGAGRTGPDSKGNSSKSENRSGTSIQESLNPLARAQPPPIDPDSALGKALNRLQRAIKAKEEGMPQPA